MWCMVFTRTFQTDLPGARNQVDVVLQQHKEILLFQHWLKLLSPAERRISYTDGIACVAKTQTTEGQEMCYTQQHNWEQADRGIFIYTHCISLFCWHGKHRLMPVGHKTGLFRVKITDCSLSYRLWPDRSKELKRCPASPCPGGAVPNMCCSASAQLYFRNPFQVSRRSLHAVDFDVSD